MTLHYDSRWLKYEGNKFILNLFNLLEVCIIHFPEKLLNQFKDNNILSLVNYLLTVP